MATKNENKRVVAWLEAKIANKDPNHALGFLLGVTEGLLIILEARVPGVSECLREIADEKEAETSKGH